MNLGCSPASRNGKASPPPRILSKVLGETLFVQIPWVFLPPNKQNQSFISVGAKLGAAAYGVHENHHPSRGTLVPLYYFAMSQVLWSDRNHHLIEFGFRKPWGRSSGPLLER